VLVREKDNMAEATSHWAEQPMEATARVITNYSILSTRNTLGFCRWFNKVQTKLAKKTEQRPLKAYVTTTQ
jgi:hypothetical protein